MNKKPKLLISECLFGVPCRYDGKDNYIETIEALKLFQTVYFVMVTIITATNTTKTFTNQQIRFTHVIYPLVNTVKIIYKKRLTEVSLMVTRTGIEPVRLFLTDGF